MKIKMVLYVLLPDNQELLYAKNSLRKMKIGLGLGLRLDLSSAIISFTTGFTAQLALLFISIMGVLFG